MHVFFRGITAASTGRHQQRRQPHVEYHISILLFLPHKSGERLKIISTTTTITTTTNKLKKNPVLRVKVEVGFACGLGVEIAWAIENRGHPSNAEVK